MTTDAVHVLPRIVVFRGHAGPTIDQWAEPEPSPSEQAFALLVSGAKDLAHKWPHLSSDDLHTISIPSGVDRRIHGAVLTHLRREGVIEPDGYVKSIREASGARPIVNFRSTLFVPPTPEVKPDDRPPPA